MKPSGIGGQAVLEGVMMKNQETYAVAVRKPDKQIVVEKKEFHGIAEKYPWLGWVFIRGVVNFIESMVLGMRTLTFSASFYEEEEQEPSKLEQKLISMMGEKAEAVMMGCTVAVSVVLAVAIFMLLPFWIASLLERVITSRAVLTLVEGLIRITIFIGYVLAISMMQDIRRVFMYHGAEHKSINCIEHGLPLTMENVKQQSTRHKRCGTSFMLFVILLSALFFMFIRVDNMWLRMLFRILLIPVIAGVSYELIKLAGRSENKLVELVSRPGLWLQGLTTREPDEEMIEVAIQSVEAVFDWQAFLADAVPIEGAPEPSEAKNVLTKPEERKQEKPSENKGVAAKQKKEAPLPKKETEKTGGKEQEVEKTERLRESSEAEELVQTDSEAKERENETKVEETGIKAKKTGWKQPTAELEAVGEKEAAQETQVIQEAKKEIAAARESEEPVSRPQRMERAEKAEKAERTEAVRKAEGKAENGTTAGKPVRRPAGTEAGAPKTAMSPASRTASGNTSAKAATGTTPARKPVPRTAPAAGKKLSEAKPSRPGASASSDSASLNSASAKAPIGKNVSSMPSPAGAAVLPEAAQAEPSGTKPSGTKPSKIELPKTDPSKAEPPKTEPSGTELSKTEPSKAEPSGISQVKAALSKTESRRAVSEAGRTQPAAPKAEPRKTAVAGTDRIRMEKGKQAVGTGERSGARKQASSGTASKEIGARPAGNASATGKTSTAGKANPAGKANLAGNATGKSRPVAIKEETASTVEHPIAEHLTAVRSTAAKDRDTFEERPTIKKEEAVPEEPTERPVKHQTKKGEEISQEEIEEKKENLVKRARPEPVAKRNTAAKSSMMKQIEENEDDEILNALDRFFVYKKEENQKNGNDKDSGRPNRTGAGRL